MQPKPISKTNAILQIVGIFILFVVISNLIGRMIFGNNASFALGIVPLLVWLYFVELIWSRTSEESIQRRRARGKRKPISTWFIVAMLPLVAIIIFFVYLNVSK